MDLDAVERLVAAAYGRYHDRVVTFFRLVGRELSGYRLSVPTRYVLRRLDDLWDCEEDARTRLKQDLEYTLPTEDGVVWLPGERTTRGEIWDTAPDEWTTHDIILRAIACNLNRIRRDLYHAQVSVERRNRAHVHRWEWKSSLARVHIWASVASVDNLKVLVRTVRYREHLHDAIHRNWSWNRQ